MQRRTRKPKGKHRKHNSDRLSVTAMREQSFARNIPKLIVIDARPWVNARANQAMGKGTENVKHYEHCEVRHMDIPNIHKVLLIVCY
jgi:hypothetical protein